MKKEAIKKTIVDILQYIAIAILLLSGFITAIFVVCYLPIKYILYLETIGKIASDTTEILIFAYPLSLAVLGLIITSIHDLYRKNLSELERKNTQLNSYK